MAHCRRNGQPRRKSRPTFPPYKHTNPISVHAYRPTPSAFFPPLGLATLSQASRRLRGSKLIDRFRSPEPRFAGRF